jgi:hypothetical protein
MGPEEYTHGHNRRLTMSETSFFVSGAPATFATSGEKPWKSALAAQIPPPCLRGEETGLKLTFSLASLTNANQPFDVDNLCEPAFSVLVNRVGWFGHSRPNITWWQATKEIGSPIGCSFHVSTEPALLLPNLAPSWEGVYSGSLPQSGTAPELADWARQLGSGRPVASDSCALYLGFGRTDINIGDICTGRVKSIIDCLYPVLGGAAGKPEDHRISTLVVEKGVGTLDGNDLAVRIWAPSAATAAGKSVPEPASPPAVAPQFPPRFATNPCKPGSCKYIVCEAALSGASISELKAGLERQRAGSSKNWRQYLSDVRMENRLDIQVVEDHLVCRGNL